MQANLSKVGWAVLVGRLHPNVSARDTRSLGGSDAVPSFLFHSVHWPRSSSGNCHPQGFTEDAGVPWPHPAPIPHRAPRCPWCKIQSARYGPESSASVLLPALLSFLSPPHSLYSGHVGLLTVPGTHRLRSSHRAFAHAVLSPQIPLPPDTHCECSVTASASSSERSSLVSFCRTAHCHSLPCLISPHSSQHPLTYHRFYLFAYYLLPLLECRGEAFCLFGSQTVSRVPST